MAISEKASAHLRLACIQFQPAIGQLDDNLKSMERLIRQAAGLGATVAVLPELADSGYVFDSQEELATIAAPIPAGRSAVLLCSLAYELGMHIVSGLAERDGDRFFNAAMLCGPSGPIGTYRKLHLWNREKLYFQPGNLGLPVFDTAIGRIGLAICYDGWFPETYRQLALQGAELVCVPTNWVPMPGQGNHLEPMANILHKAAAHSNGIYIACADRVGTERGQPFVGRSMIVGPTGWPIAGPASEQDEEILIATIRLGDVASSRALSERNDAIGDRRTDVYG
ncbi:MAG: hydratase [Mesorhizobium sp.]|uniref:nitrilase family protein n=1 Tax=Mesorhizobium sp. TaxID=1871066 RepID=UPI0012244D9E|nr:nitrilase family protein [Mesorhizobium sp.]TIP28769.1 MAG: hydratase [Mesorhizobium sp.]